MTFAKRLRELRELQQQVSGFQNEVWAHLCVTDFLMGNYEAIAELVEAVEAFTDPNRQYNLDKVDGAYFKAMTEALKKLNGGAG